MDHIEEKKPISRQLKYFLKNQTRLLAEKKIKITCSCGCVVSIGGKTQHLKTDKHKLMSGATPDLEVAKTTPVKPKLIFDCPCGSSVRASGKKRHMGTKKHKLFLESQVNSP
jgi:hypothetical protein